MKPHILFFLIPLLLLFVSCSDETNPSGFDKVDSLEEVKSAETILENANTKDSCSLTARDVIEAARDYRSSVNRVRVGKESDVEETLQAALDSFSTLQSLHEIMVAACSTQLPDPDVEVCDGIDNDGDGQIDEGFPYCIDGQEAPNTDGVVCDPGFYDVDENPANGCELTGVVPGPGDLMINEIMFNPVGIADSDGEWIEILNTTSNYLELRGSTLISSSALFGGFNIDKNILIPPGGFVVLANNADPSTNGGVQIDFEYNGIIPNDSDEKFSLYAPSPDGDILIDAAYTFIGITSEGQSQSLDPSSGTTANNDFSTHWYGESSNVYDTVNGNYGTPRAPNNPQ